MKPDLYTKAVLTVIALALVMIACNQYVHPATTAEAQASSLLFSDSNGVSSFFDPRTGELWQYGTHDNDGSLWYKYRLTKPGQLVKEHDFRDKK